VKDRSRFSNRLLISIYSTSGKLAFDLLKVRIGNREQLEPYQISAFSKVLELVLLLVFSAGDGTLCCDGV